MESKISSLPFLTLLVGRRRVSAIENEVTHTVRMLRAILEDETSSRRKPVQREPLQPQLIDYRLKIKKEDLL